jgi:hypothetical protein
MIFTASLAMPARKALGQKSFQTNINKIIDTLPIDPSISDMDAVILGPKDVIGPIGVKVQRAVDNKHEQVCVVYLYEKDNQKELLNCQYKKQVRKIRDAEIKEAQDTFLHDHYVHVGKMVVLPKDLQTPEQVSEEDTQKKPSEEITIAKEVIEEVAPTVELPKLESLEEPTNFQAVDDAVSNIASPKLNIEDTLRQITNYKDWSLFKEQMEKDSVVKHLIDENTEYVGLLNMLEVMDKRIDLVWRDMGLSTEQKFNRIIEIGQEKSNLRSRTNQIQVDKVLRIIESVTIAAKRTVEERIDSVNKAMYQLTTSKEAMFDSSKIDKLIEQRSNVQLELLLLVRELIDLYKSMNLLVTDQIHDLDARLPSSNDFINNLVTPVSNIFTPVNSSDLVTHMMKALQENRVTMSMLEDKLNKLIDTIFNMFQLDEDIIKFQQHRIAQLRANRVEDIVIIDSLLKNVLRVYTGLDNTGATATTLTWCGILSRRHNTLLIDLTGKRKLSTYGVQPVELDDFLTSRPEQQFLCVQGNKMDSEEIQELVNTLKSRLNYYPYINILVEPEDVNTIDQLSDDALTIHYITDCSIRSISAMRKLVITHTTENIARKLITIDCPVNPIMIAEELSLDTENLKIIPIPNLKEIKACALKSERPYDKEIVVQAFEEAFR